MWILFPSLQRNAENIFIEFMSHPFPGILLINYKQLSWVILKGEIGALYSHFAGWEIALQ